ncbi:putative aminopeptidase-2 [Prorops nasuta]|uniref:putative aminopeptidase-2 n=1 Tax=Prorops nasuta TaxID=863751 RepID=UPI0034D00EA3
MMVTIVLTVFLLTIKGSSLFPQGDKILDQVETEGNYRLPDNVVPIHYNILLAPEIADGNFNGTSIIDIEIRKPSMEIVLHSKNLNIYEEASTIKSSSGNVSQPEKHTYDKTDQTVTLYFESPLESGLYTLNLNYSGILADEQEGLYRTSYVNDCGNTVWLAATYFKMGSARRAFPCWDEPTLKATFNISIKHMANYTALSNMPERTQTAVGKRDQKQWTHFKMTPIMSTFMVAFVIITDYARIPIFEGTTNIWSKKSMIKFTKQINKAAYSANNIFEEYTNISIPVPKIDHVAIPNYPLAAMGSWGLLIYNEREFLYDANNNDTQDKIFITLNVNYKMASQWFGNMVSPTWWDSYWLYESFAEFLKYHVVRKAYLKNMITLYLLQDNVFLIDVNLKQPPLRTNLTNSFGLPIRSKVLIHTKGPCLLNMALHLVTEKIFREAVNTFLTKYKYNTATADDFWNTLQEALDKSDAPNKNFKIKEVMDSYINQNGFPLITANRNNDTGEIFVMQQMLITESELEKEKDFITTFGTRNNTYIIPLSITSRRQPNFINTQASFWLRPETSNITIRTVEPNDWYILNLQSNGLYRVNYDIDNWKKISEYLNSDNFSKIHILNRAQIINDGFFMTMTNRINLTMYLDILQYLSRETDYGIWRTVFGMLSSYYDWINSPKYASTLKPYILGLMQHVISSTGFEESPKDGDQIKLWRSKIMKWACQFDYKPCLDTAHANLVEYLKDPENSKISPDYWHWTFCFGMRIANESTWKKMLEHYKKESCRAVIYDLGCSANQTILKNYLNMTLAKDSPIEKDHLLDVYRTVMESSSIGMNLTLDFLLKNSDKINAAVHKPGDIANFAINRVLTFTQLEKVKALLNKFGVNTNKISRREETLKLSETYLRQIENWINTRMPIFLSEKIKNNVSHAEIFEHMPFKVAFYYRQYHGKRYNNFYGVSISNKNRIDNLLISNLIVLILFTCSTISHMRPFWNMQCDMDFIINSIIVILLFTITTISTLQDIQPDYDIDDFHDLPFRLSNDTVPIQYIIKLIPYIQENNFTFDGTTSIIFKVRKSTASLVLHIKDLKLDEGYTKLEINGTFIMPTEHYYYLIYDQLQLSFGKTLEPGIYTIHFKFKGVLNDLPEGFYKTSYKDDNGNKVYLAVTQFEPFSARRAFPCWDEIGLKATFNVSIKHDANYTALSNMPAYEKVVDKNDGKIWTKFKTTPIMSTYVLAFLISDFVQISNDNSTINMWGRKNAGYILTDYHDVAQNVTRSMEKYLNRSIAVPKTDHVIVPEHIAIATEHWGLITYKESSMYADPKNNQEYDRMASIPTVVHELAHQWFGNLVTPVWWTHIWLSEGLSTYFEYFFLDKIYPEMQKMDYFPLFPRSQAFIHDSHEVSPIIIDLWSQTDFETIFSFITYFKPPCILHMLNNAISEKVFHKGLLTYLDRHEFKSTTSDDLWDAFQSILDSDNNIHNDLNIKQVMDPWIYQPGYPMLTARRDYSSGNVIIIQQLFLSNQSFQISRTTKEFDEFKWYIPINYATQSHQNFTNTLASHWLKPEFDNLTIYGVNPNDWIIINLQQTGYYRVNYDQENWKRIAKYMKLNNHTDIHFLNRAQLIDDAYEMIMQQQLDSDVFLEITDYLTKEDNFIVWAVVTKILKNLRLYFTIPTEGEPLQDHFLSLMTNIVRKVKSVDHDKLSELGKTTKAKILKWACFLGHKECRDTAEINLHTFFNQKNASTAIKFIKEEDICSGLMNGNEIIWYKVLDLYKKNLDTRYLSALTCTENKTLIESLMKMAIYNNGTEDANKVFDQIFAYLSSSEMDHAQTIISFIENNFDIFNTRFTPTFYTQLDWREILFLVINNSFNMDHLIKIKKMRSEQQNVDEIFKDEILAEREKVIIKHNTIIKIMKSWLDMNKENGEASHQVANRDLTFRLPNDTLPIQYIIKLIPYLKENNFTFDGTISTIFKVQKPTDKVVLHVKDLNLDEEYTKLESNGNFMKPVEHYYHKEFEQLQLSFANILKPGIYTMHFKYRGVLNNVTEGFFRTSYKDNNGNSVYLAATFFEPFYARRAFPCWDEIGLKATFNVSIKHDASYTALSNMPAYEKVVDGIDGKVWTKFKTTPIMSTYVLAFVLSDFIRVSNTDKTINVWGQLLYQKRITLLFLNIELRQRSILASFYTSVKQTILNNNLNKPQLFFYCMSFYYRESDIYSNSTDASFILGSSIVPAIVHELTHQWFGNLVTPIWWTHIWLSEGIASYFQFFFTDKIFPERQTMDYFNVIIQSMALEIDSYKTLPIVLDEKSQNDFRSIFSFITYLKSACILNMLSNAISEKVFHDGLLIYLDRHEFKSTTSDDLWESFQSSLNSTNIIHNDLNVKQAMDSWIYKPSYPVLTAQRDYRTGHIILTQQLSLPKRTYSYMFETHHPIDMNAHKWSIPINYATKSHKDFTNTLASHWLKPEDVNLTIYDVDIKDWFIINVQQIGYYRVNYDLINWRRIAKHLNSNNYSDIHFKNRAQIVGDTFYFVVQEQLDFSTFSEVTSFLLKEENFVVWAMVINILDRLETYFITPFEVKNIKKHILSLMTNMIKKVKSMNDEKLSILEKPIKAQLLHWACKLNHPQC